MCIRDRPYIAVDTIQSTTINNQHYNSLDTVANIIGQIYNQSSTFVSIIYTSAMSNGWSWIYSPTSKTCMTLDVSGNLQTNSLQSFSPTTAYNLFTNQTTGAINIGSVSTGIQNINIGNNSTGTVQITNALIKANSLQSSSNTCLLYTSPSPRDS